MSSLQGVQGTERVVSSMAFCCPPRTPPRGLLGGGGAVPMAGHSWAHAPSHLAQLTTNNRDRWARHADSRPGCSHVADSFLCPEHHPACHSVCLPGPNNGQLTPYGRRRQGRRGDLPTVAQRVGCGAKTRTSCPRASQRCVTLTGSPAESHGADARALCCARK